MRVLETLGVVVLVTLTQILTVQAQECTIVSISSPTASSLLVQWTRLQGITNYILDLRVVNESNTSPVVASVPGSMSMKEVFGLKTGTCSVDISDNLFKSTIKYSHLARMGLVVGNLRPATTYDCYVVTSNAGGLGARSRIRTVTTSLGPVTSVSVSYTCASGSAVVSWTAVFGATTYRATATSRSGAVLSCTSSTTECQIRNLACGENYIVRVTTLSDNCESTGNATTSFQTAPCHARNMRPSTDCQTGLMTSSWEGAAGALRYTVEAFGNRGNQSHYMCSSLTQSCTISDINCGESLTMIITASDNECSSVLSLGEVGQTAPCVPQDVSALMECGSDSISLTWDPSLGAFLYFAMVVDQFGTAHTCTSSDTKCKFSGLHCGSIYNASVIASNAICNSSVSESISVETAPCPPGSVEALLDCQENQALVSWLGPRSMISFTATMEDQVGGLLSCSTTANSCRIPNLKCGQVYDISVIYHDGICPSMPSHAIQMKSEKQINVSQPEDFSVPCGPTNVRAEVQCPSGVLSLSWNRTEDAEGYITTIVSETSRELVFCNSTLPSCNVSSLQCGTSYSVQVKSYNGSCVSMPSLPLVVTEVPCVPTNVTARRTCGSSTVEVSWSASRGAQSYVAVAVGDDRHRTKCSSNTTTCSIPDLHCSSVYSISVVAVDGNCSSWESQSVTLHTVPCPPTDVQSTMNCSTNSATLSWTASANAVSYRGRALGTDGHTVTCDARTPGCQLNGLHCGQEYVFVITASDGSCESPDSVKNRHATAPCAPQSVSRFLDCASNILNVSWALGFTALNYTVLARTTGGTVLSCTTTSSGCIITGLQCGKNYTTVVTANNGECQGPESVISPVQTVPCIPTSVHANVECVSNTVRASWGPAAGALSYTGVLTGPGHYNESCLTSGLSCSFRGLTCAQTYTLNVISQDSQCNSPVSPNASVTTAPCDPESVTAVLKCDSRTVNVAWHAAAGASMYTVLAQTQNQSIPPSSCRTSATSCDLTQINCGEVFNVTVLADDGACNSSARVSTTLESAPCPPTMRPTSLNCSTNVALVSWVKDPDANVTVRLQCLNNTAVVSWEGSPGAVGYNITAVGHDGDIKHSTVTGTSCQLPNMHCGQTYDIVITPFSQTCNGFPTAPYTFNAGSCPASDVQASLQCNGNVGLVRWTAARNAENYIAMATGKDGHTHTCTSSGTNCTFSDLHCGEDYTVTVSTVERGCQSQPTTPVNLRSAICPPSNLAGYTNCATDDIRITWDPSQGSGVTYFLFIHQVDGLNSTFNTTQTSYVLTGLHCGMSFIVQAAAQDSTCTSPYGSPTQIYTAPCPPSSLTAAASCGTNRVTISWLNGTGAHSYTASVVGNNGPTVSCTSNTTSCSVKVECGHTYIATVVSTVGLCNSTTINSIQFKSADCLPSNVIAQVGCNSDMLAVHWDTSTNNADSYTALAIGTDGTRLSCSTSSTTCTIQNLRCGQTYSIAVTTSNVNCGVIEGSDYQIETAPCQPQSPAVQLQCSTNIATVTWDNNGADQFDVVTALNFTGGATVCNSTDRSCTFAQLRCGESYSLSVVGFNGNCTSEPSESFNLNTAPCMPTYVVATTDCSTSITTVSWDSARGASSYTVYAVSTWGSNSTCTNTDTTCSFPDLDCGQNYTITVTAEDDNCVSLTSAPISVTTDPCPQSDLQVTLDCSTDSALISWTPGRGTLIYNASAKGFDVNHQVSCSTPGSACNVTNLHCGSRYQVSVRGEGLICPSQSDDWIALKTAPCPPTQVSIRSSCDSDTVSVSWKTSQGSVSYMAVADNSEGHRVTCNTSDLACDITGLQCGQTYQIYVSGVDGDCIGSRSEVHILETAPCVPQNVQTILECQSTVLNVTWQQKGQARRYHTTVRSSDGQVLGCDSNTTFCQVPNILCGLTYSVTVVAYSQTCNSSQSSVQHITSAPCPPDAIFAVLDCDLNTVSVSWDSSVDGVLYIAQAFYSNNNNGYYMCNTTETSCDITVTCGMDYNVSVVPLRDGCTGENSPVQYITAAPCSPLMLDVEMDCLSDSAWLTWEESAGAELYIATATDSDGFEYQSPCPPQNVTTSVGCDTGTLSVLWDESVGALSYTATLERTNGETTWCTASSTSCEVTSLPCSQMYVLTVTAEGRTCNSSQSLKVIIRSVPCIPESLVSSTSCSDNVVTMSWVSNEAVSSELYTVQAFSADGLFSDSCSGFGQSCDLTSLMCGVPYTATVIAQDSVCTSAPSQAASIRTVPCVPDHVTANVSCQGNDLSVFWEESAGADFYTAVLEDSNGQFTSCQSMNPTTCTVNRLVCGQTYRVSVTASDGYCDSLPSAITDVHSEPCPPQNVQTHLNCASDVGTVSWEESLGAVSYVAFLEGRNGHSLSCSTTSSSCSVTGLICGAVYNTQVRAIGEIYNSTDSETILFTSAPCKPVYDSVTVDVNCENATALFSWAWSGGAASYELTAISNNGYISSCISQENFCNISELACGQTYTVRLTAINDECQITQETGVTFQTRPCAPLYVNVDLQCKPSTAIVTWEQMDDVLYYLVSATLSTGESDTICNSTTDSCEKSGLQCGVEYAFTVTAYSSHCHSDFSSTVHITTEPCQPTQPTVSGSCDNNTVVLNWSHSKGALSYKVHITSNLGYDDSFQTSESTLTVELLCGQTYTFTTLGENGVCDGIPSTPAHFTTAPCVPYHIETYAECENNLGAVSWASSDGTDIYTAIAIGQDNHTHVCITNTTYCIWEELHCGEIYFVQVIANAQICSSGPSDGTVIHMAPCIPQNLVSSFDCDMRVGSLIWEASENAEMYLVSAESTSGHRVELSTNTTSAQFSEFECGQSYYLTVQVVGNVCRSQPSNASVLQTEPCTPTSVFGFTDCISNIATVSWEPAEGAEYYTATVQGPNGPLGTCMSWLSSCGMPKLSCGETYNVSVIASSRQCNSTPSALSALNSVPCVPTGVSVVLDCATAEAHVSWNASMGALNYVAYAWSRTFNFMSCESSGPVTHCTLNDLICGDNYTVQVIAVGDECSSLPSQAEHFRTVPCAPEVTATLDCYTDSVLLQWTPTDGSISYTANAETPKGLVSTCSSNSTNCELRGLACGQTYNVTMISYDGHCHSMPGTALAVASVPCPPEKVESNLLCSTNSAHVQWNLGAGAESYEVHAISTGGQMTRCDSTNTSCVMPNLGCGSIYNISVLAIGHQCNVSRSEITTLHSVPCVPNHIQANLSLGSGVVDVSWQPSKGALSYTAVAQGSGGFASSCNSSSTTCEFSDLLCGLTYSISVTASDRVCTSAPSHSVQLDTVPCEPHGIVAQMECSSHTGVVSWEQGERVASYLVQASSPDGHQVYCSSPTTSCRLASLHCGQAYNLTLTAQDSHCNSQNAFSQLHSVPCAPTSVQASLVCLSNSAAVTWQSASGALSYQAEGITVDGTHMVYCNSSVPHCNLEHLLCGETYNVSVLSMDHTCSSEESLFTKVHTAPCPPHTVDVEVNCSAGSMTVTWPANPDAESFHVRAETSGGAFLSCDSTSTSCSISGLSCGQSYSVTVTSVRGGCESRRSTAVNVTSAPCVPQGETGNLDCVTNSAWVNWLQAKGAESYTVLAVERGGTNSSCSATDLHCNVPDLLCGATYTFHVTAVNSFCRSTPGNAFQIQTAPCALTSITAHTDCYSSHITVSWQMNEGTSFYVATAEGHDQSILMCNSTGTSCDLSRAKCGMQYTIIISASSDKCSSLRSPPLKMHTAPCAPQNITVNPVCDSNGMTAAWSPSLVAESYSLTASSIDGDVRTCRSTANNCTLLHLHCGQIYDVSITASAGNCTSMASQQVTFYSVPCEPQNMTVEVQCDTRTATLSWVEGQGSLQYFTMAQTIDGHMLHCDTTSTSCSIHGLTCGMLYNFSALASDGTCNSSLTVPIQRGAVPCPPATVRVRTHLMADATLIRVYWNFVYCPDVTYLVRVTGDIQDNPESLMEVSSYWTDISYFEFPVSCSSSYSVTVLAQNSAGISRPSQAVTGVTVPCPPMNVTFRGDSSSATVAWRSSALTTGYRVYQLSSDGRVPVCLTSNLSCEVSGLQASNVAVSAWNTAGESLASRVATDENAI
ncbi:hypothetical protein cypCar_00024381 [Cyprinus carpio]|nr:hypothetical protein cypCar_00024381 [Cyprinus carpio]